LSLSILQTGGASFISQKGSSALCAIAASARKISMRFRPLIFLVDRLRLAKWIGARLGGNRFRKWTRHNPDRPFSDFYVGQVEATLKKGKGHPTLGNRGFTQTDPLAVEWTAETFSTRGEKQWDYYAKVTAVSPNDKCVDFGCGSLRIGQHAIRQLGAGNYWGLDVTDSFVETGLGLIDPMLLITKRPHFSIIDDNSIEVVRAWQPKAIFANAVVQHVPPRELPTFFQRIARIMAPGAVAAIVFIADADVTQVKAMSWAYPDEVLTSAVLEVDRKLKARCFPIEGGDSKTFHSGRRLLKMERTA
jgi:hypothetical protein